VITKKGIPFPILYLFLYRSIRIKARGMTFVSHRCLMELFRRRIYFIPKPLYSKIIKEMEELKLIKKLGNSNNIRYELIGKDIDKLLNQHLPII
jgi:hypothetical protein